MPSASSPILPDRLLHLRPEALVEKSLRIRRSTPVQLSVTSGIIKPFPLGGASKAFSPHPGFRNCHPGQFLTRTFRLQKKRVIIWFSPDFLRILQKICFMMEKSPILAVVVPCYKEEAVLHETHKRLSQLFDRLIQSRQISPESYILYVNDGSTDQTWPIIKELHRNAAYACGLNLAGNVGHQNALLAGLNAVKDHCEIAISIDADLQDDIQVIPDMISSYKAGNDIVYGVRKERKTDTFFKRNSALVFYRLMKAMGVKSVYNHADYRLMSQRAVQHLCRFRERNLFFGDWSPSSAIRQTACTTTATNALPENQSTLSGRCSTLPSTASLPFP